MLPTLGIAHAYIRALDSVDAPRVRTTSPAPRTSRIRHLVNRRSR